ncbi:glycosyltransferase family 2 protein [Sandaracinus amylolyticus]|nr:glycosyltransferase family 2 protein [Sandaracinus amylolyticus]
MKLLVVLLNYRTPDMTLKALKSAYRAIENIPDARIDIVDNDSQDGSYDKLRAGVREGRYAPERVQVLASDRNGGFGAGNNFAIRRALASEDPPELVYILNSDAFPAADAVEVLVDFLETHPHVGIAGSYIHGTDGVPHHTAFRFPSLWSELESGLALGVVSKLLDAHRVAIDPMPSHTREVDWLAGASMMMRAEVLREVGLFDETFFLYFEETDLCRRAKLAGWPTWYVVESKVAHVGSASTGMKQWRRVPTYWFDSRKHYFTKNHGAAYRRAADVVFAATHGVYKVRARIQQKKDPNPHGFFRDFLRYNFGLPVPVKPAPEKPEAAKSTGSTGADNDGGVKVA